MQEYISDLSNYLKESLTFTKEEKPIMQDFIENNALTTASKNCLIRKESELVLEYANNKFPNQTMYFVQDAKMPFWRDNKREYDERAFAVLKVENGKVEKVAIPKKLLPESFCVNKVFTKQNGKYVYEKEASTYMKDVLNFYAQYVFNNQQMKLDVERKEGHLYLITEEIGNNRFLWDLTDKPQNEFEEVLISQDLLNQATEGTVLKYNGKNYEFYSDNGYEMIY